MPSRIEQEKQTVERMVRLYCRKKEGNKQLCPRCEELLGYARIRLSRCPFGENKSTCRQCSIHCYKPEMKERMREVMRYAGPRMLLYHPVAALRHLWQEYVHQYFTKRFGVPRQEQHKHICGNDGGHNGLQQLVHKAGRFIEHLQEHQEGQHQAHVRHAIVEGFLNHFTNAVPAFEIARPGQRPDDCDDDGGNGLHAKRK